MQPTGALTLLFWATSPLAALAVMSGDNPLGKVLDLMHHLAATVTEDGEKEAKAYKEFVEWCENAAVNAGFEVKTASAQQAQLEAKIDEFASKIQAATTKIEELVAAISVSSKDLKSAEQVREREASEFAAKEGELRDIVDTLGRAVSVIEREMQKNPAALAQVDSTNMEGVVRMLGALVDAATISGDDQQKLVALVQAREAADSDEAAFGAPDPAAYKSHSSGILDVLDDLKDKSETQLSDLRKAEVSSKHNFELLKQSLSDQIAADTKDMEDEKASKAEAEEGKAAAAGELEVTVKELSGAQEAKETAATNCMQTAADHEATVKGREEELKVIAEAIKILDSTASGAAEQTYSFAQVKVASTQRAKMQTRAELARHEVVTIVKRLAREHHSAALAQLASRIATVMRYGTSGGSDPFAKVKGLIQGLIAQLEKEAGAEASEKAYCDEEMAKAEAKKGELEDGKSQLKAKIDQAVAKSAELTEQVKELEGELSALAKQQAGMDTIRQEEHADYVKAKEDLVAGVSGVRNALGVLRDYYAAKEEDSAAAMLQQNADSGAKTEQPATPEKFEKSSGAGAALIGILEVVENDFAENLVKVETEEEDAQSEYDKMTQENKIGKAKKDQDVKFKSQTVKSLEKGIADLSSDRNTMEAELAAVLEYDKKLKERCIAQPESYEERKTRREAEIKGLKEALATLEDEAAFVQRKRRGNIRGWSLSF